MSGGLPPTALLPSWICIVLRTNCPGGSYFRLVLHSIKTQSPTGVLQAPTIAVALFTLIDSGGQLLAALLFFFFFFVRYVGQCCGKHNLY